MLEGVAVVDGHFTILSGSSDSSAFFRVDHTGDRSDDGRPDFQ
jgi:hypothetical protein